MEEKCPNLEMCSFFKEFAGNSEVVKNGWIRLFCENLIKSDRCQRKQYKQKNGVAPPVNMAPTGTIL